MSKPKTIAIEHDDRHAGHIGTLQDGRQFFLTNPFVPAIGSNAGREFIALYLFNKHGHFIEARIDDMGSRADLELRRFQSAFEQRLKELGPITFERIIVRPFQVLQFGVTFGLLLRRVENTEDEWAVEAHPGNYMAFFEPWDSGEYDT